MPKNIEDLTEYQCDSIGLRLDWNYSIMLYIIIHFNSVSKAHKQQTEAMTHKHKKHRKTERRETVQ